MRLGQEQKFIDAVGPGARHHDVGCGEHIGVGVRKVFVPAISRRLVQRGIQIPGACDVHDLKVFGELRQPGAYHVIQPACAETSPHEQDDRLAVIETEESTSRRRIAAQ